MKVIHDVYRIVVETVCRVCLTDPVMMFSSNKEIYVDARGMLIVILVEYKFSESLISDLTGLTQQAVNRLKKYLSRPDKTSLSAFSHPTTNSRRIINNLTTR